MTTWSSGPFGNDGAAEWALALKVTDDFAVLEHALDGSFEDGSFVHGACPRGVAAVAVLAEFLECCEGRSRTAPPSEGEVSAPEIDDWLRSTFARIYDVADHIDEWVQARLVADDSPSSKLLSKAAYFTEALLADPEQRSRAVEEPYAEGWVQEVRQLHAIVIGALLPHSAAATIVDRRDRDTQGRRRDEAAPAPARTDVSG